MAQLYQPKHLLLASLFLVYAIHVSEAGPNPIPKKTPVSKLIPGFATLAHGVRSGNIIVKDSRTLIVQSLYYDGAGPDAYFFVGNGPTIHTAAGRKIPNERGTLDVLGGYQGEDIELVLPKDLTVNDIDWISIYCVAFKENFGYAMIPKGLDVPDAVDLD